MIADPSGSWTPGTAEQYIDSQIATVTGNLASETVARQTGDSNLQTQLNAEVTTRYNTDQQHSTEIDQLRVLYENLTQSDIIVGPRPSSGQLTNVIYREPDQTHTPPQNYSDYMWYNNGWVLMATYDNAIDNEPTAGSNNLVKSGGVYKFLNDNQLIPDETVKISEITINDLLLTPDGTTANVTDYYTSNYIEVTNKSELEGYGIFILNINHAGYCVYDENKSFIAAGGSISASNPTVERFNIVEAYPNAKYIRISLVGVIANAYYTIYNDNVQKKIADLQKDVNDIYDIVSPNINVKISEITINDLILRPDGTTANVTGYYTSNYIEVTNKSELEGYGIFILNAAWAGYCVYDENKSFIAAGGSISTSNPTVERFNIVEAYPNAKYIRITLIENITNSYYTIFSNSDLGIIQDDVNKLKEEIIINPISATTLIVKQNGTIGTDCDFTDIGAALDSITNNTYNNRFIVYVKNGTYDITGVNYLGFKNYVTVRGESQDGVVVRNSTQTSDQSVVCFDPEKYGSSRIIDYAAIENMTLRILGGKCCVHIDGYSIKSGGKILIKNIHFINENPESLGGRGGVNCGLNGGQTIEIENCYGNALAYAHSRVNPSTEAEPNNFIFKNCHLNFIGYYDLNDKVKDGGHNRLTVNSCICDYIGIGVGYQAAVKTYNSIIYEIGNDNKFNWVYIYGQGSMVGYDSWYTRYPICSSIHRVAENHTGNTISKGTFVSVVRSQYNSVPSAQNAQPQYLYNIVPYSGGELFGVAMENIADGENGIIQVEGKILIADNNYTAGQYITLNESGIPVVGTKENAIGIVTDANQQYLGTLVLMKKRDYDYIL